MNKLVPMILGVALLSGSMAMAAPSHVCKTHRNVAVKKVVKHVASKKVAAKSVVLKK